jgi:hypothetical protein
MPCISCSPSSADLGADRFHAQQHGVGRARRQAQHGAGHAALERVPRLLLHAPDAGDLAQAVGKAHPDVDLVEQRKIDLHHPAIGGVARHRNRDPDPGRPRLHAQAGVGGRWPGEARPGSQCGVSVECVGGIGQGRHGRPGIDDVGLAREL